MVYLSSHRSGTRCAAIRASSKSSPHSRQRTLQRPNEDRPRIAMNEFFQRLKQRKLVQWAIAYVAAAFALLQGIDIVAQQFGWPEAERRGITLALVVGFLVTLVLAWYHGERGAQRVTGRELLIISNRASSAILISLLATLAWRKSQKKHEANKMLDELNELSKQQYVSAYEVATIYVALGNNEQAFQLLEQAYGEHSFHLVYLNVSPQFKPVSSDPRFQNLVQRVGLSR